MIEDIVFKLVRKGLPRGFYRKLVHGFFGRGRKYHRPETYAGIYRHYVESGLAFRDRIVVEVGPGDQFHTALLILADGAKEVLVADPVANPATLAEHIASFKGLFGRELPADAASRVRIHKDIGEVPASYDGRVDVICSNHVLEHVSGMDGFFANNRRLLAPSGIAYHRVDVSDHTYHVFDRFSFTRSISPSRALYHLRYSHRGFERLNDGKCWMNRLLLPHYVGSATRHGLKVSEVKRVPHKVVPIHPDLLAGQNDPAPVDLYLSEFSFKLGA